MPENLKNTEVDTETAESAKNPRKFNFDKHKVKKIAIGLLPILALAVLFLFYIILLNVKGYLVGPSLEGIINQVIVLAIVATGAIFIFSLGSFDISLGASTLFAITIAIIVYNATGNVFLMFIVAIAVGVACSLVNSTLASVFRIPMFVTTVAMLSVLTALSSNIITSLGTPSGANIIISVSKDLKPALAALDNIWFKLLILASFAVLCLFVFNFTKVGRRQKFLGNNPFCAKMTGISMSKYAIIAFLMAGIGVGLGAGMNVVYAPSVSSSTAGSIGMNVFIAIVFGGMPISGGARSKIYAALIGGVSYTILNNILSILFESVQGARDGYAQIVSAVLFLAVVFAASINYRVKHLPR